MAANSGPQIEPSKQPCSLPNNSCSWTSFRAIPQKKHQKMISFSYPSITCLTSSCRICQCPTRWLTWSHLLCPPAKPKLCLLVKSVATSNWSFSNKSETLQMQSTSPSNSFERNSCISSICASIGKSVRSTLEIEMTAPHSTHRFLLLPATVLMETHQIVERRWNFECWNLCSDLNLTMKRQTSPGNPTNRCLKAEWLAM